MSSFASPSHLTYQTFADFIIFTAVALFFGLVAGFLAARIEEDEDAMRTRVFAKDKDIASTPALANRKSNHGTPLVANKFDPNFRGIFSPIDSEVNPISPSRWDTPIHSFSKRANSHAYTFSEAGRLCATKAQPSKRFTFGLRHGPLKLNLSNFTKFSSPVQVLPSDWIYLPKKKDYSVGGTLNCHLEWEGSKRRFHFGPGGIYIDPACAGKDDMGRTVECKHDSAFLARYPETYDDRDQSISLSWQWSKGQR